MPSIGDRARRNGSDLSIRKFIATGSLLVHEGIDTTHGENPDPSARLWLSGGRCLSRTDEIVTYSARGISSLIRGFHVFPCGSLPRVARTTAEGAGADRRPGDGRELWAQTRKKPPATRHNCFAELDGKGRFETGALFSGTFRTSSTSRYCRSPRFHVYLTYPFCAFLVALGGDGGWMSRHRLSFHRQSRR